MTTAEMEELRKLIREEFAKLMLSPVTVSAVSAPSGWTKGGFVDMVAAHDQLQKAFVEVPKKGEFVFVAPPDESKPRGGYF